MYRYTEQQQNVKTTVIQSLTNGQRPDKSPRKIIIVRKSRTINNDHIPDRVKLQHWQWRERSPGYKWSDEARLIREWGGQRHG